MSLQYMNDADIKKAFDQFKDDVRLHPEVLWGGCTERTKIICDALNKDKPQAGFMCLPKEGWTDEKLSCRAILQNGKEDEFFWIRHFVPVVQNKKGEIIVLDICLMDGPERLKDWIKYISFEGKTLKMGNYSLNHPNNIYALQVHLRGQDPFDRLQGTAANFPDRNIIPHQKKSNWLKEQMALKCLSCSRVR